MTYQEKKEVVIKHLYNTGFETKKRKDLNKLSLSKLKRRLYNFEYLNDKNKTNQKSFKNWFKKISKKAYNILTK